jgi:phage baseplate assembly protein W
MPEFQTFKDLSVTFKKHPVTDDLIAVKDNAAIVQSISNLLLTRRGERPFQSDLGSDLAKTLFEPLDYASSGIVRSEVVRVLKRYEPRITIDSISCVPQYMDNGYQVELSYTIVGRDDAPVTVEFFLERTR